MTSFHVPNEDAIRAHLAALDDAGTGNVLPFRRAPRTPSVEAPGAEIRRKLSLEGAACFVDTLRAHTLAAPREMVTPARMARLLAEVAKEIRALKQLPLGPEDNAS